MDGKRYFILTRRKRLKQIKKTFIQLLRISTFIALFSSITTPTKFVRMIKSYCVLFVLLICISTCVQAQLSPTIKRTFYVVRHAEKDTGTNPAISIAGRKRAADLFKELKGKKINMIMVTQYRRTAMTGDSLRIYKNVDTVHYVADAIGESFLQKVKTLSPKYKNILVIGHSNTLQGIIKQVGVADFSAKDIPDNEYDNLFVVKTKKGKAVLQSKKYGLPSLPAANNTRMNSSQ